VQEPPPAARPEERVIVTGSTSLIGDYLLPHLVEKGFEVHAISRTPRFNENVYSPEEAGRLPCDEILQGQKMIWHQLDISQNSPALPRQAHTLIHLAPLAILPPLIDHLASLGIQRIIAFGSTSLYTKQNSGYQREREMARKLAESEQQIAELCAKHHIHWTVFRPTLVYSLGRDKNITTITQFIQRFGFFPLVGAGKGLRQPVHAEDLATACIEVLDKPISFGKAYNLSGGETLTYREMVRRIFVHLDKPNRIVTIPLPALRIVLRGLSCFPFYSHLTPEMANRINQDMCFDHSSARGDFHFAPRKFLDSSWRRDLLIG
jgi:nucleoside-diphosphate-sugar epimerase